ncbi:2-hydroxyacid dehydrogenase [Psychromarinibacter halotolerans]|uniref:2-hydroxyacid dehydrogenase n=1 Tax=Psychromarinibacter halotolerans TaxID=1775175 RepID=A0ABV7GQB9_9RHOB|nr:2-hydroxyacid dehydrogenase [Psychromarinibacter halotolerans]MDF0596621.1 2-hydroxyacid dehydrogenase [Psychromarinibacter halotolerans]
MSGGPDAIVLGTVTDRMRARLDEKFTVHAVGTDSVPEALLGASYICCGQGGASVRADLIDAMPELKIISNFGVGYDNVDAAHAASKGVVVSHTPDVLNDEVANTAILLMLASARNFRHDEDWARSGTWEKQGAAPLSRSVKGATVGILGLGRIGEALAEKLGVFGVTVVYHNRSEKPVPYTYYGDLVEMARDADILISVAPGGASTHHIVNAEVLKALGPDGLLVNVGRGSVVDETALVAALSSGTLGAAALDVFEHEPKIPDALKTMDNVVLLPHVGSATVETRAAMGDLVVDNLIAMLETGKARTPVPECRDI